MVLRTTVMHDTMVMPPPLPPLTPPRYLARSNTFKTIPSDHHHARPRTALTASEGAGSRAATTTTTKTTAATTATITTTTTTTIKPTAIITMMTTTAPPGFRGMEGKNRAAILHAETAAMPEIQALRTTATTGRKLEAVIPVAVVVVTATTGAARTAR